MSFVEEMSIKSFEEIRKLISPLKPNEFGVCNNPKSREEIEHDIVKGLELIVNRLEGLYNNLQHHIKESE